MARGPVPISRAVLQEHCTRFNCSALECAVPENIITPLAIFLELLTQWNKVMNLVGTRQWQDTLNVLLVDSFHLAHFLRSLPLPAGLHTWDLGAGAGIPGIPLRMVWTEGRYFLVEAREKRALFLSTALARMPLPGTEVFRGRAEDFFAVAPQPADLVVSRAFMPWQQVLDLVRPHIQPIPHATGDDNGTGGNGQNGESGLRQGGRVVFLSLEKSPEDMPQGWEMEASYRYIVGKKDKRYFWCLRAKREPQEGVGSSLEPAGTSASAVPPASGEASETAKTGDCGKPEGHPC